MQIFSWNIQNGKGCDGIIDLQNIVNFIKANCEPEVICLQEVARHFAEHGDQDQLAFLETAFDDYSCVWAPGFSWPQSPAQFDSKPPSKELRQEFGNLVLVKKGLLLDYKVHTLPSPAAHGLMQMPRTAVEVVVAHQQSAIRIISSHLAFHSYDERIAQLDYLTALKDLAHARSLHPANDQKTGCYRPAPSPQGTFLCGDLNVALGESDYQHIINSGWVDVWPTLYPDKEHLPTCGIYDHQQWPQGAHCRDYFLCSSDVTAQLECMQVDIQSAASDHQPIWLTLKNTF